jgi:hypothetical protein
MTRQFPAPVIHQSGEVLAEFQKSPDMSIKQDIALSRQSAPLVLLLEPSAACEFRKGFEKTKFGGVEHVNPKEFLEYDKLSVSVYY